MSEDRWVETAEGWQGTLPVGVAHYDPEVVAVAEEGVEVVVGWLAAGVLGRLGTREDPEEWLRCAREVVAGARAADLAGWHGIAGALLTAVADVAARDDALRAEIDDDDAVRGALVDGGQW